MAMQGMVRWVMLAALLMCFLATQGEGAPGDVRAELGTSATTSAVSSLEGAATAAGAAGGGGRARRSTAAAGEGEESDYNADEPDYEDSEGGEGDEEEAPVGPPPNFLSKSMSVTLRPGDNVTLPCNLDRNTTLPRIWLNGSLTLAVNKQILGSDRIQVLDDMSLFIHNVQPRDTGAYTCQVTSNPLTNLTHFIKVPLPAKIIDHSPKTTVVHGDPLMLKCIVEGFPKPSVSWTLQGHDVSGAKFAEDGTILKIDSVNKHHAGNYECTADNGVGKPTSVTISVQVSTKPQVTVIREMIKSGEGETVELACNVTGQPRPNLKWLKGREEVEIGTGRFQVSANSITYTLRIKDLEKSDFGTYSCTAKNKHGSRQKNITISGTPATPEYAGHVIENDKIVLRWNVESFAPIQAHELLYRKAGNDDWIVLKPEVKDALNNNYKVDVEMPALPSGRYEAYLRSQNEFGWTDSQTATFEGHGADKSGEESKNVKPAAETSKRGPDDGSSASVVCSVSMLSSALVSAFVFTSLANHL